jgi:hypothetical protein
MPPNAEGKDQPSQNETSTADGGHGMECMDTGDAAQVSQNPGGLERSLLFRPARRRWRDGTDNRPTPAVDEVGNRLNRTDVVRFCRMDFESGEVRVNRP